MSTPITDPQLRENGAVVPLEGAGGKLTQIISNPMQVHDIAKVVPAKQAPEIGVHIEAVLKELRFDPQAIDRRVRPPGA